MANVFVEESSLQDIADAIRGKNGLTETYKPSEMADAIDAIPTGGITPTGTKPISITANGTTSEDVTNYATASITANVPNTYAAGDEGKVVENGALVSQSSATYTQNNTYDTTKINSVTVNVSGQPTGTKQISITSNGTTTEDVAAYANAEITVAVAGYQSTSGSVELEENSTTLSFPCNFKPDFVKVTGKGVTSATRHCNGFYLHDENCGYVRGRNANGTSSTTFTVGMGSTYVFGTTFGSYYKAEYDSVNKVVTLTTRSGYGFITDANPYNYVAGKYT